MRLLNWYLMRFCFDLLIDHWRRRRRMLAPVPASGAFVPPVIASYSYPSPPYDPQDAARVELLRCLAGARVRLTAWEAQFVRVNLWRACFTEKQKTVIDQLRTKYQSRR
jgi:hypothetical protein